MAGNWFDNKSHVVLVGLLIALSYVLLMFGNGIVSLTHPDEVFYIQSAKEMLSHKSWITPMIFDEIQFEKPFIPYALFALSIKLFGLTPFAARFFPSVFAIAGVVAVYWTAWILFKRKQLAFLSGMILSSSFIYIALARAVLTDMIFTTLTTTSICFFCYAYYDRRHKKYGIIFWLVFSGVAVLTKGLLGFLFPITTVLIFLLYKKDLTFLRTRDTVIGLLAFLLIAVPWHLVMYYRHGPFFLEEYFYNVHWRRILMAEHPRLDNWYFYIMLIFVGVTPWFLFWIPAMRCIVLQFKRRMASREKLFLLLAWMGCVYAFTQPAHSKLASYIFPLFPAAAIILAYTVNCALDRAANGETLRLVKWIGYVMSVLLLIIAAGGIMVAKNYSAIVYDMMPVYTGAILLVVLSLIMGILLKKNVLSVMVYSHLGVSFILLLVLYLSKPMIEPWVSCKHISEELMRRDQSQTPVLASKFYVRGVRYYTDRPVAVIDIRGKGFWSPHPIPFMNTDNQVITYLTQHKATWAIVKEGNLIDLRRMLVSYTNIHIHELSEIGGKYLLRIERDE